MTHFLITTNFCPLLPQSFVVGMVAVLIEGCGKIGVGDALGGGSRDLVNL